VHIRIINPNTTAALTLQCLAAGRAAAGLDVILSATNPSAGTPSVESHLDETVAGVGVVEQVLAGEREGVDGYVIACFGDTGLGAAREIARGPVVGMTEAALYAAALIAPVFSIITLPSRTRGFAERCVLHAGLERRCPRVRAIDVAVLDCVDEEAAVLSAFLGEARRAIDDDHAEAIVLGCAGLQALAGPLHAALGVPIVEGVGAAVKMVEALLALGLSTSKRGEWGEPPAKAFSGPLAPLLPRGPLP
jgi:allantoin racemase